MTVKEYANDVNVTPAEVLKRCQELGIEVNDANDLLTDEILLECMEDCNTETVDIANDLFEYKKNK